MSFALSLCLSRDSKTPRPHRVKFSQGIRIYRSDIQLQRGTDFSAIRRHMIDIFFPMQGHCVCPSFFCCQTWLQVSSQCDHILILPCGTMEDMAPKSGHIAPFLHISRREPRKGSLTLLPLFCLQRREGGKNSSKCPFLCFSPQRTGKLPRSGNGREGARQKVLRDGADVSWVPKGARKGRKSAARMYGGRGLVVLCLLINLR